MTARIRPAIPPPSTEKVGKKIDFIAKALAATLELHGFVRKGRTLCCLVGEGNARCWQIVNLQADKWNEGSEGSFFVNLSLQFPAVIALRSQLSLFEWEAKWAEQPNEAAGQTRKRFDFSYRKGRFLSFVMPKKIFSRGSVRISVETDLQDLAQHFGVAIIERALPWFSAHNNLSALRDSKGSQYMQSPFDRVAAAILLGDPVAGNRVIQQHIDFFTGFPPERLVELCRWLTQNGLNDSVLAPEGG